MTPEEHCKEIFFAVCAKGYSKEEVCAVTVRTVYYGHATRFYCEVTFQSTRFKGYRTNLDAWESGHSLASARAACDAWVEKLERPLSAEQGWQILGGSGP